MAKLPITARLSDGFVNLVNSLGTSKDFRIATQYGLTVMDPAQLLTAYRSNWLARRIVDCIADDATREWRNWQASEEQIEKIEEAEKKLFLQKKLKQALVRARLFGGGCIIMGIDGAGTVEEELDLERVKQDSLKFVLALSSIEVTAGQRIPDVTSPWYGRPEYYTINTWQASMKDPQARIHPSRVIEFVGSEIPDVNITNGGHLWGDSVLQSVDDVLKDYGTSISAIAQLINDSKVDVFKLPGLTKNIATPAYENRIATRLATTNKMKSYINAIVMDKEEEWERIQTQFAGLPPIMEELLKVVAGAAGIPMTRLVGHGAGTGKSTLNGASGGQSDLRNYYDSVTSIQKNDYAPVIAPLDEVLIRSATGGLDPSIYYEWAPLYTPDPNEEAAIATQKATVMQADATAGLINPDVMREVRINQLIEDGFYPGLQDAIDEFGAEPEEPEVSPDDVAAHIGMLQQSSQQLQQIGKAANPDGAAPPAPAKKPGGAAAFRKALRKP